MEDKIELNVFLNKLVYAITRKFEKIENDLKEIKVEIEKTKQNGNMKDIEEKIKNLEFSVNSIKNKSQIDRSILKLIETEEQERKA